MNILMMFFVANISAQQGQIEYLFDEPENKYILRPILQFNQSKSIFIYNRTGFDSPSEEGVSSKDGVGLHLSFTSGDKQGNQTYIDFKEKKIISRIPYSKIVDAYVTPDNWVDIKWNIKKETKKIGSYNTTKAIGSFRGRNYTVWFTYEIPLPIGPWKLKGLPGAILEAIDDENSFVVKFVSAKYPCDCANLLTIPSADKQLTLQEHVYLKDNIDAVLLKKIQAKLPREAQGRLTRVEKSKKEKRKQKKEKTYEWETQEKDDNKK